MNWPQAYIMPERPCAFGVAASPSPTTMLLIVRGFGPPIISPLPSAKRAGARRTKASPAALTPRVRQVVPRAVCSPKLHHSRASDNIAAA